MRFRRLFALLPVLFLIAAKSYAQCPTSANASPGLSGGGTAWGASSAQMNTYFGAKVDANGGTLCNPTIVGGTNIVTSFGVAPGLTGTFGVRNTSLQDIANLGNVYPQNFIVAKSTSYVVNGDFGGISDSGATLVATSSGITFTLPNPSTSTRGVSYSFASDGSHLYTLTTVGGTANFYGCQVSAASLAVGAAVSVTVIDGGTNYLCRIGLGSNATPQFASLALGGATLGSNTLAVAGTSSMIPAANTDGLDISGLSLTGSAANAGLSITGTWNTSGAPDGLLVNITNTASGANSRLFDVQSAGTSVLSADPLGIVRVNGISGGNTLSVSGTNTSTDTGTDQSISTAEQFQPGGASLTALRAISSISQLSGSSDTVSEYSGVYSALTTTSGFTGSVTNGYGYRSHNPSISGGSMPGFAGFYQDSITNCSGTATLNCTNIGFKLDAISAVPASGGTITNEGALIAMPSGVNAGTETAIGLAITGNGPTGGSTNWAIKSTSTADSELTGGLDATPIGATTASTGAFTTLSASATVSSTTTQTPQLKVGGSFVGSVTSGQAIFNSVNINNDTVNTTGTGGPGGAFGMYVGENMASASLTGGRTTLESFLNITNATGNGATNHDFYVSGASLAQASANDGGVTGAGNGAGNLTAGNDVAQLLSGATFWNGLNGRETDIAVASGASVFYKVGDKIVQLATDASAGTTEDYAFGLVNQANGTAPGWAHGITFGAAEGWWPLQSSATMIGTIPATIGGGPSYSAALGVDLSAVTFSTGAFKSNGFLVDGSGNVTAGSSATDSVELTGGATGGTIAASGGSLTFKSGATDILDYGATTSGDWTLLGTNGLLAISTGSNYAGTLAFGANNAQVATASSGGTLTLGGTSYTKTIMDGNTQIELGVGAGPTDVLDYGTTTSGVTTLPQPTTLSNATVKLSALAAAAGANQVCSGTGGLLTTVASGTACASSAMRFKDPKELLDEAAAPQKLMDLRPAVWTYKDTTEYGDKPYVGLYADDVAKMDPRCVTRDKDGKLLNYYDRCVTAWLTADMQLSDKKNDERDKKIDKLIAIVQQQAREISELKAHR